MKTFNIDLWQYIKHAKDSNGDVIFNGKTFFGLAPEDTPAPYCVLHVLDSGDDETSKTLCYKDENYNRNGVSDIQFTVYAINDMQLDELLQELNNIISRISNLSLYRIKIVQRGVTKTASSFSSEVGAGLTRYSFKYELL